MVLMLMNIRSYMVRFAAAGLLLVLSACGGGGGGDGSGGGVTPPPPPQTGIGPAGGTVLGPNGAKVEIPPGALATNIEIEIEQTSAGAPALPATFSVLGQMFTFTPHGTSFALPVTVTLPFDAASVPAGVAPALYKTNAQSQWEPVADATFSADSVTAQVTSFSYFALDSVELVREWSFNELRGDQVKEFKVRGDTQITGDLDETFDYGAGNFGNPFFVGDELLPANGHAHGEIWSTADGVTYWVGAEAPLGNPADPEDAIGSKTKLTQTQTFIKRADNATLSFTVTEAWVEGYDLNAVLARKCPENHAFEFACDLVRAQIELEVKAATVKVNPIDSVRTIFHTHGAAAVVGFAGSWHHLASSYGNSRTPFWSDENFEFFVDPVDEHSGAYAFKGLVGTRRFTVDLSSIEVCEETTPEDECPRFTLTSVASAMTYNRAAGSVSGKGAEFETAANAWLRDPLEFGGATTTFTGLEPIVTALPLVLPVEVPEPPAPCIPGPGPDPAAGVLQFSAPSYTLAESSTGPTITVTRISGSSGAVTATFTTSDGTAIAGTDYSAVNSTVFFADGDAVPRVVDVPIIANLIDEPDKTVNLTLSEAGGCAALGTRTTAVATILGDDQPPPLSFTIGGTVTGFVGTGLVLQNLGTNDLSPGNGAFTFTIPFASGIPYNVTVAAQPANPTQVCTVANGSGTVDDANVTNVTVTCVTPDATPGLDPLFGSDGKVTTGMPGGAKAMALQTDGKMVLVGGKTLARYLSNGSPDSSFAGGSVTVLMSAAQAVAIQPDGMILVAGFSRTTTQDDFAVERYDANGILDASFSGGSVTTDFNGGGDKAWAVLVQDNGSIVVAGHAAISTALGPDNDFAVARYDSSGALDMSFNVDGKVTTNVGGRTDLTSAAALQPDGGIVLTGRVSDNGVGADVGLVRYDGNGNPDTGFGMQGIARTSLASLPSDVAFQADGKILVAVRAVAGGTNVFGVVRFEGDGDVDTAFGTGGLATAGFSTLNDFPAAVVVQSDDRIVVAGQSSNLTNPDFAIARFTAGGTLDGSFDSDGKLTVDFFDSFDGAECAAIQADGKIVVGGFARNGTSTVLGLVRVVP